MLSSRIMNLSPTFGMADFNLICYFKVIPTVKVYKLSSLFCSAVIILLRYDRAVARIQLFAFRFPSRAQMLPVSTAPCYRGRGESKKRSVEIMQIPVNRSHELFP